MVALSKNTYILEVLLLCDFLQGGNPPPPPPKKKVLEKLFGIFNSFIKFPSCVKAFHSLIAGI